MRTSQNSWEGCASLTSSLSHHDSHSCSRMRRADARPHPKQTLLHQVKVVLELGDEIALTLEQSDILHFVAAENFDCLQLHEVFLGPRRVEHNRREQREV